MKISLKKDLTAPREAALVEIQTQYDACRLKHLSLGKTDVYEAKRKEADRYLAKGKPKDLTEYPWLAAEIGITADTAAALAQIWIQKSTTTEGIGPAIERVVMTAKKAVREARTPAEIDAVLRDLDWP